MLGKIKVVTEAEYEKWLEESFTIDESIPLDEYGAKLYKSRACYTCHSIDGSGNEGPTLKGIFGHEVTLADGSVITVNENYIRESVLDPQAKIVIGYKPVMPTYQGRLRDREIDALIAYIKSLEK